MNDELERLKRARGKTYDLQRRIEVLEATGKIDRDTRSALMARTVAIADALDPPKYVRPPSQSARQ